MERIEGAERYQKFIKWLLVVILVCFAIWATPRSIISSATEIRAMGGPTHPQLGNLGVMSAKNTAVNLIILITFISFLFYRRSGKKLVGTKARIIKITQAAVLSLAGLTVIFLGIYGYMVEARVRIFFSIPMVLSVIVAMLVVTILDVMMFKGAEEYGETKWGKIAPISQYTLIFLACSFTWLMALMGYVRSGLRGPWHVYGVMRDTSPGAFTPTLGFATQVVSVTVLIFFVFIGIVFWLASLTGKKNWEPKVRGTQV